MDIFEAVQNGDLVNLNKLIAAGIDVENKNSTGNAPLHLAAISGKCDCVKALLDAGANPERKTNKISNRNDHSWPGGLTPMMLVGHRPQEEFKNCVKLLLAAGAKSVTNVRYDIFDSIANELNGIDGLQYWIDSGIDLEDQSPGGWAPIHHAAANGRIKSLELLIDAGVNIERKTINGETALMLAVVHDECECIEKLLLSGANLLASNATGNIVLNLNPCAEGNDWDGCGLALVREIYIAREQKLLHAETDSHSTNSTINRLRI